MQGRVRGKVNGNIQDHVVDNEDYSTVDTLEFQAELEMNAGTEPDYASCDAAKVYIDIDTENSLKRSQHSEGASCNPLDRS